MQLLWRQRKNRKTIRGEIKEKSKREKKKEKQYARGYVRYPARMKIRVDKWEKASLTMIYKQTGSSARERYRLIQKKETTILPNRLPSCCSMPITSSHRCTTRQMARQRWRYCHDLRTGAWAMISESSHRNLRDDWAHIALPSKTRICRWPLVSREDEGGRGMLGGDTKRGQAVVSPVSCMYDGCMNVGIHVSECRSTDTDNPESLPLAAISGAGGDQLRFPIS